MRQILLRPVITEKMTSITEKQNKYGFIVDGNANKIEIAKAVEKRFKVDVEDVNTVNHKGKLKLQMTKKGRFEGRTPSYKKAIVTIKSGQKIEMFGQE